LINQHDRSKIQVHLLSDCERAAIKHGYTVQESDRYFDTSKMTNTEIAELVKHSGIDILVDLNGYSNMNRLPLFAQKVAPVVVGWFNMYATTGMSGFDYLIGDSDVVKANEEEFYSEKLMRVKGSYLTFDVAYPVPPVVARFRNEDEFVFGSLASQYKITDQVIEAWSKILRACPHSSLLLKNKQLGLVSAQAHLLARFATHGINSNRLHLEGPEPHFDFLKAYDRIDIALDTFPYNGGTTTTEAIWQGVPVVTFDGDRWASRTSASILRAAGLGEFVASDVDGYINLALRLGFGEPLPERLGLRTRLADSSACDTRSFAVQIEQLYLNCV
jgi:predicted O-linked N-acetylglucosamine transferase (SPINDLY family)